MKRRKILYGRVSSGATTATLKRQRQACNGFLHENGRCGLYVRSATGDRRAMAMQEDEGIKLCRRNGWQHQVFRDVGKPGVEMRKLMKLVRARKLDHVFVFRWDRLGRELRQVTALLNEFRRRGVRIVTADRCEQCIPAGTLFADLAAACRQYELSLMAQRQRWALARRRNRR